MKSLPTSNSRTQESIDPEAVIAWLVTQPNANGSLFLERVARQYMSALRTTPAKLELQSDLAVRDVFTCNTPQELLNLWNVLKTAPNYALVNTASSGFSAAMRSLLKYLQHIYKTSVASHDKSEPTNSQSPQRYNAQLVEEHVVAKEAAKAGLRQASLLLAGVSSETIKNFTSILSERFSNGFRLNSSIELTRFRTFAKQHLNEEIALSDYALTKSIVACGTTFEGKVYIVSVMAKGRIKKLVEEYFAGGGQALFYSEFYAQNERWLFCEGVVSKNMLVEILRNMFPKLSFTQTYFGYTTAAVSAVLESEILRVWEQDTLLTYSQLAERLVYIPIERIKSHLAQNGDFIWNSVKTFSHISRVIILPEEQEFIRQTVAQACATQGYISITELSLEDIEDRNHELSTTAIHSAVFRICLSDMFEKKGKIVARRGDTLNALNIMTNHCRTLEKCTLDDLLAYEKELIGEVHRWIPMEAANAVLVRTDKDTYVADKFVHFDSIATDAAIELFMTGDYLSLKSFTTFGTFPDCGQPWNLFLLESYCRRFSKKFRFDTLSVNSRNAGAVIRSQFGLSYLEIMSDAVVNAEIPLTTAAVGKFLSTAGYTGRRTTKTVAEVLNEAMVASKGKI